MKVTVPGPKGLREEGGGIVEGTIETRAFVTKDFAGSTLFG